MGFIDIVKLIVFCAHVTIVCPGSSVCCLTVPPKTASLCSFYPLFKAYWGSGGRGAGGLRAAVLWQRWRRLLEEVGRDRVVGRKEGGPTQGCGSRGGSSGTVPAAVVVVGRGAAQWPQWQWHPWRGGPAAADGGGRHGRLGLVGGPSEVNGGVGSRAVRGAVVGADCPVIIFDVCVPQNVGVVAGAARSSFSRHTAGLAQPVDGRSLATICSFSARLRLTTRAWQRKVGCGRRPRRRRSAAMAFPIVPPLYPGGRCWRASRVAGGGGSAAAADAAVTPATSPVAAFAPVDESAAVAAAMAVAGPLTASPARSSAAAGQLRRGQRSRPLRGWPQCWSQTGL